MYQVYAKLNDGGVVLGIQSNAFLVDAEGWTLIDEGSGDRYAHAQGNYLPQPLMTEDGQYRYRAHKDGDGWTIVQRSADELTGTDAPGLTDRVDALDQSMEILLEGATADE